MPFLEENIYHIAILIGCSPQVMLDTIDLYEHFIDVECIAESLTFSFQAFGELRTKLITPEPDCFVADFNTAL